MGYNWINDCLITYIDNPFFPWLTKTKYMTIANSSSLKKGLIKPGSLTNNLFYAIHSKLILSRFKNMSNRRKLLKIFYYIIFI